MEPKLKSILFHNIILKIVSCVLGIIIWSMMSSSHYATVQKVIPLCFYGTLDAHTIHAPETITVTLRGKRCALKQLDLDTLALHVNAHQLHGGPNRIPVSSATLFLPADINVVHYSPSNALITVTKNM